MKTAKFDIHINAPKETVWDVLWSEDSYGKWTAAFCEGSYAKSDWQEGSKIQFLSPGGDGMFSRIYKKNPYAQMTFQHLGEIRGGVEQEESDWAGAMETYVLADSNGGTGLTVEVDTVEEYLKHFEDAFPKALQLVKRLSETKITAPAV